MPARRGFLPPALTLTALATAAAIATAGACAGPAAPAPPAASAPPAATSSPNTAAGQAAAAPQTPPNIPVGQQDDAFMAALQRNHLDPGSADQASQLGHGVCRELDANVPIDQLVNDVQTSAATTSLQDTGYVIGAATGVYCPQNLPKLPKS